MQRNKIILILFVLLSCLSAVFAQEVVPKSEKVPKVADRVILVGRVVYKTPVDREARIPEVKEDYQDFSSEDSVELRYGEQSYSNRYIIGKPFFFEVRRDYQKKQVPLYYFNAFLFDRNDYRFILPLFVNVVVPDGVKFAYIGTFEYDLDYALNVKGIKRYDEYDLACEWLKVATGNENVELIRCELVPMEE
jgi:hypothetical protein